MGYTLTTLSFAPFKYDSAHRYRSGQFRCLLTVLSGFRDVLLKGRIIAVDLEPNQRARVVYLRDTDGTTFEFIEKPT